MGYTVVSKVEITGPAQAPSPDEAVEILSKAPWNGSIVSVRIEVVLNSVRFFIVRIDETQLWTRKYQKFGPIYGVYFYDPGEAAHLAEIMPSFRLYPLYSYCEEDAPEDILTEKSEVQSEDVVHTNQVPQVIRSESFEIEEGASYEDAVNKAQEYWRRNHPI